MTFIEMLQGAQRRNGSMLCVGLDPEPTRFPAHLKGDAGKIYDFCARIVDATADLVIAFKPQIAYFAAHRAESQLEQLMEHMRRTAPHVPVILDAKRGDIGSTAEQYAKEAFERYGADAVTLSPFMGFDSVQPYLKYEGKGAFLLCRTSNPGGDDLQNQRLSSVKGEPLLYEHVASLAQGPWNLNGQLGLVVGATYPAEIERVRQVAPTLPLLIPGVGAQGGDAVATVKAGWRADAPIVVNSSRAILYASGRRRLRRGSQARSTQDAGSAGSSEAVNAADIESSLWQRPELVTCRGARRFQLRPRPLGQRDVAWRFGLPGSDGHRLAVFVDRDENDQALRGGLQFARLHVAAAHLHRDVHAGVAGIGQAGLHFHQFADAHRVMEADATDEDRHAIALGPAGGAGVAGLVDPFHDGAAMHVAAEVDGAGFGQEAQGDGGHGWIIYCALS